LSNFASIKKELHDRFRRNEEDSQAIKADLENSKQLRGQEIGSLNDKLQRLAAQFDKELMERDKRLVKIK